MKEDSVYKIEISSSTIFKIILAILLVVVLYLVKDLVLVVLAAVVIASSVEPMTKWFIKYRIKRLPAVVITYVCVGAIFFGVFYAMLPPVIGETSQFLSQLPTYLEKAQSFDVLNNPDVLVATQGVGNLADFPFSNVLDNIRQVLVNTSKGVIETISFVFGGALSFLLIVVLSFYFAAQEDGVANFLKVVTPLKKQGYVIGLWKRSREKIGLWMQGQIVLVILIGVLVYLGLTILGIKNALLLAILAGLFELIPVFGPVLAAIPAILVALFEGGGVTSALLVAGLYIIIQQFENHLIYPLVVQKIVGVSPIIVILAFIIGAKLAGFLGILLAVPLSAALMEYFNDLQKEKMSEEEKLRLLS